MEQMMSDGRNGSGLMAGSAGPGRHVRLAHWSDRKWKSSGFDCCVSTGGIRQEAASRQMTNPANTRRNW